MKVAGKQTRKEQKRIRREAENGEEQKRKDAS